MHPQVESRYPQRMMSVANLVRDRDPPKLSPVRDVVHRASATSTPLWGPHHRPNEPVRYISVSRAQTYGHEERQPQESTQQVAEESQPVWHGSVAHKESKEENVGIDIKRYAKLLTPFIYKLYCLVADESTNSLCEWASRGNAFIVHDPVTFSAQVLPQYFKHNQFSSFVRQLNKYSFHKLAPGSCIFGHTHFVKDHPELLLHIGPPRPQDRNGERGYQNLAGGGASLSSLHKETGTSKSELEPAVMSQGAVPAREAPTDALDVPQGKKPDSLHTDRKYEQSTPARHCLLSDRGNDPAASLQRIRSLRGRPMLFSCSGLESATTGHSDVADGEKVRRSDVEDIVLRMQQQLVQEFSRDLSIAKNERDELLHRLCAVERRNNDLEEELLGCHRKIEALEHCNSNQSMDLRRLRVKVKGTPDNGRKRFRGSPPEEPLTMRSGG